MLWVPIIHYKYYGKCLLMAAV